MVRLGHPRRFESSPGRLHESPPGRLLLGAATLLAALLTGPLLPHGAYAMISSCRTDPIITLSDGTQLDITASIDTPPGRVTSVSYVVHVPAGLSAEKVVYTGGEFTNKESLKLYADQQPGSYSTTTYVGTESVTTMTATSTMRPASSESGGDRGNSHSASASIDGHTEQDLTVNF